MKAVIHLLLFMIVVSCKTSKESALYQKEINEFQLSYKSGFLDNPRSPLNQDDLVNIHFFKADASWKLKCRCTKTTDPRPFDMPTYSGVTRTYMQHSTLDCNRKGTSIHLELYKNIHQPINPLYKNHLFLPFKDLTNGDTTYGGGRYINLMDTNIKNDSLEIDFNTAYNPWCAYSDGYNCPIPPRPNHVALHIEAGEKIFKGIHKTPDK
ncbi:MAG: DUF1684 domain-containing protein [Saprospiraceae bacterium]|nr:DUF1684 domain-containing protein [Saprospiraceae bacterium]